MFKIEPEQRNLFITVVASLAILIGFHFLYERPKIERGIEKRTNQQQLVEKDQKQNQDKIHLQNFVLKLPPSSDLKKIVTKNIALKEPRIQIRSKTISGSINLGSGMIDDITLNTYKETTQANSNHVSLLVPQNVEKACFIETSWVGSAYTDIIQQQTQNWTVSEVPEDRTKNQLAVTLTPTQPITLYKENSSIRLERIFQIDEHYLITITDRVINKTDNEITIHPVMSIKRHETPQTGGYYILHEGPIGFLSQKLIEIDYKDFQKTLRQDFQTTGGWCGFTDKYWLISLFCNPKVSAQTSFTKDTVQLISQDTQTSLSVERYTSTIFYAEHFLGKKQNIEFTHKAFVGPKVLDILNHYQNTLNVERLELAIDFGWFYFLTKPLFLFLEYLHQILGNFGLAILTLTVFVKMLAFPLAFKTQKSMGGIQRLQPEIERIKTQYGTDKIRFNQELMLLYKQKKVNPMSGCLPMLIQAPIFFCLYKVLFVTIEMRHAPFYGWIKDLSQPDPTSFFNLFGLLPFTPPTFLMIGLWPILMGLSMWIQQKLNTKQKTVVDPNQEKIMMLLPVVFTYLFASFPSGLVIYWTWSNILTILQTLILSWALPKFIYGTRTIEVMNVTQKHEESKKKIKTIKETK
jgi:YidC/Oxa1 family membrane protein insertase